MDYQSEINNYTIQYNTCIVMINHILILSIFNDLRLSNVIMVVKNMLRKLSVA